MNYTSSQLSEMPECQLVYLFVKHGFRHGYSNELFINELRNRFNIDWFNRPVGYIDNMVAEYILLYKKD